MQQLFLNEFKNSIVVSYSSSGSFLYCTCYGYRCRLFVAAPKRRRPLWHISISIHYGDMQCSTMLNEYQRCFISNLAGYCNLYNQQWLNNVSTTSTTTACAEFYCVNLPLACVILCQFRSKKYVGAEKIISESELATLSFIIWWKQHNIAAEQHNFAFKLLRWLVGQHILSRTHIIIGVIT